MVKIEQFAQLLLYLDPLPSLIVAISNTDFRADQDDGVSSVALTGR